MSRRYRLVSSPPGAQKLAIGYLIGAMPEVEHALSVALPGHKLVLTDDGSPSFSRAADVDAVCKLAGLPVTAPIGMLAWSAGCQVIRQALLGNAIPNLDFVACFDGTAATWTDKGLDNPSAQIAVDLWARVMKRAAANEFAAIFTCSSMTYTERLTPAQGGPFAATWHVLEAALGQALKADEPFERGSLLVERFASADIDAPAHIRQLRQIAPMLLAQQVGHANAAGVEWWPGAVAKACVNAMAAAQQMLFAPPAGRLACVAWCEAELARGVKEQPPGSNDSPRIREYFSIPDYKRAGKPLHVDHVAWCAAAQSMCHHECGVEIPAFVSGVEYETWAASSGHAAGATDTPEPGWLAIFHRPGVGWERHVTRVRAVHDDGSYETIAGNEAGDQWAISQHPHPSKDPAFSSFVRV